MGGLIQIFREVLFILCFHSLDVFKKSENSGKRIFFGRSKTVNMDINRGFFNTFYLGFPPTSYAF